MVVHGSWLVFMVFLGIFMVLGWFSWILVGLTGQLENLAKREPCSYLHSQSCAMLFHDGHFLVPTKLCFVYQQWQAPPLLLQV